MNFPNQSSLSSFNNRGGYGNNSVSTMMMMSSHSSHHIQSKPIRPLFKSQEGCYRLIKEIAPSKSMLKKTSNKTCSKISIYYQPSPSTLSKMSLLRGGPNSNMNSGSGGGSYSFGSHGGGSYSNSFGSINKSSINHTQQQPQPQPVTTTTASSSIVIPSQIHSSNSNGGGSYKDQQQQQQTISSSTGSTTSSTNMNIIGSNPTIEEYTMHIHQKNILSPTNQKDQLYFGHTFWDSFLFYKFTNIEGTEYEERLPIPLKSTPTCQKINKIKHLNQLQVVVGTDSGDIYYFDPLDRQQTNPLIFNRDYNKSKCTCIDWVPESNSQFIAGFSNGFLMVFDINRIDPQPPIQFNNPSSPNFYVIQQKNSKFNPVSDWNVCNNKQINAMVFSPNGKYLAVACQDGYLHIFNYDTKSPWISFQSYFGGVLSVDWSPDGKYLVTGGEDDYVSVWCFEEKCLVARGQGHQSWVGCVKFDPYIYSLDSNHYRIISGAEDTRLLLWDFSRESLRKQRGKSLSKSTSLPRHASDTLVNPRSTTTTTTTQQDDINNNNNNVSSNGVGIVVKSLPRSSVPTMMPTVSHRAHSEPVTDIACTNDWIITLSSKNLLIWARPDTAANSQKVDSVGYSMHSPNTPLEYQMHLNNN